MSQALSATELEAAQPYQGNTPGTLELKNEQMNTSILFQSHNEIHLIFLTITILQYKMWKEVNNVIMDVTFVSGLRMYIQYSAGTYGEHTDRE